MIGEFGTSWQAWDTADDPYLRGFREGIWSGALGGSVGTSMSWWWQNIAGGNDCSDYSALSAILGRTGWGAGAWTNIVFRNGSQTINCMGQKGAHKSLLYLVAADATFPSGGTNSSLSTQTGETVTLNDWPSDVYYADWYDPATAASLGRSSAITASGARTLPLPAYSVDLAGVVYPPPNFSAPGAISNGGFQVQFNSETGGNYTIEESSNLRAWTLFVVVTNTQGTTNIAIPQSMTNTTRFYRALQIQCLDYESSPAMDFSADCGHRGAGFIFADFGVDATAVRIWLACGFSPPIDTAWKQGLCSKQPVHVALFRAAPGTSAASLLYFAQKGFRHGADIRLRRVRRVWRSATGIWVVQNAPGHAQSAVSQHAL
jgi:hypothetical protein